MGRWYDSVDNKSSNIVYSRIRLARNWDEYTFPSRMTREQWREMLEHMKDGLKESLAAWTGREYRYGQLTRCRTWEKLASGAQDSWNLSGCEQEGTRGPVPFQRTRAAVLCWGGRPYQDCSSWHPVLSWMNYGIRQM